MILTKAESMKKEMDTHNLDRIEETKSVSHNQHEIEETKSTSEKPHKVLTDESLLPIKSFHPSLNINSCCFIESVVMKLKENIFLPLRFPNLFAGASSLPRNFYFLVLKVEVNQLL